MLATLLVLTALADVSTPVILPTSTPATAIVPFDPWNAQPTAECETIEDLNPTGPLFDMLDWATPDADIRATSHLSSAVVYTPGPGGAPPRDAPGAYVLQTVVTQDRITTLKTLEGDTWDVATVDDIGLWSWRTETAWNTPRSFTQFRRMGQVLMAPRKARGGFPGMRWTNCDSAFASHASCGAPARYGHLGYVIHELYGPYDYEPGWGDVRGQILKLVYFYGCATPDTASCSASEVTWMSQRHGMFAWRMYEQRGGVWTLTAAPPVTAYVVPGVIRESFPCDAEVP
jgi:hypothetical protein